MGSKQLSLLLICLCLWSFSAEAADFAVHGYYRTRAAAFWDLDTQATNNNIAHDNNRFGLVQYNQMRFRLDPMIKVNDNISIHARFDILDNVLFGTEHTKELEIVSPIVGTVTLPAGPGSYSVRGGEAGEGKAINVRAAYMDVLFPIGKLRVGRQPSHYGLGIFQNDGSGRNDDFGDYGDAIAFLTAIDFKDGGVLNGGLIWNIAFESQIDPRVSGVAGAIRDNGQDANHFALVMMYERPELTAGLVAGIRRREGGSGATTSAINGGGFPVDAGIDGDTLAYAADLYARYTYNEYDFKLEYVYIGGKISTGAALDAIPFSAYAGTGADVTGSAGGIIELPPKQTLQVNMAAFEASGAYKWGGEWIFKGGLAQGDASPLSNRITQYGFRPDYKIATLLFNVPLGTSPALWGVSSISGASEQLSGGMPITGNFINNAYYAAATYMHHFDVKNDWKNCNDVSVGIRAVTAFAQKNPVDLNFAAIMGDASLPSIQNTSKWYGVEADIIAEAEFYDHLYAGFEFGFLVPGGVFDIRTTGTTGSLIEAIPADSANFTYGGKFTLAVEF